jgi:GNAT superfamily N-acetyltransferase
MIIEVNEKNICYAAGIYSESWKDSHKQYCSPEFIELHSVEYQEEYLRNETLNGKKIYMLVEDKYIGIVSIKGNLIENLYILPKEQRKGYGTTLLKFAVDKCTDTPTLWILDKNIKAYNLYSKYGFHKTGKKNKLSASISEVEMNQRVRV